MTTTTESIVWWIIYRRSQTSKPSPALIPGTANACGFLSEYDRQNILGTPQKIVKNYIDLNLAVVSADYPCEVPNDSAPKPKDS